LDNFAPEKINHSFANFKRINLQAQNKNEKLEKTEDMTKGSDGKRHRNSVADSFDCLGYAIPNAQ
jgi:hypothetical protein